MNLIHNSNMKSIIFIFSLLFIVFYSCIAQNKLQRKQINLFLNKFEITKLPFNLDIISIEEINKSKYKLDSFEVSTFIENNKLIVNGLYLYDVYNYFAINKFYFDNFSAVIILKKGGSGGVENRYLLFVYDSKGNKISSQLIGQQIGDCSLIKIQSSIISNDYHIKIKSDEIEQNCDNGKRIILKTEYYNYKLDSLTGKIIALDD